MVGTFNLGSWNGQWPYRIVKKSIVGNKTYYYPLVIESNCFPFRKLLNYQRVICSIAFLGLNKNLGKATVMARKTHYTFGSHPIYGMYFTPLK